MKQFYELIPKQKCNYHSCNSMHNENVEYDIDILIQIEAEQIFDMDTMSPEQYDKSIEFKMDEIKSKLINNGIWYDQFGTPRFVYM